MTAADILSTLLSANIAASAAISLVVIARKPVQRRIGARLAYWLWTAPVLAGLAALLPARPAGLFPAPAAPVRPIAEATLDFATDWATTNMITVDLGQQTPAAAPLDVAAILLAVWALGAAAFLILILLRQQRTVRSFGKLSRTGAGLRSANGDIGPAIVGVIRPQLVVPMDFEARFSMRERDLVLAHERAHLAAGHTRVNAAVALATCLNWFNPLVHLAARLARVDQELACDAAVVERFPGERRIYAEALLKTQLAPASLPLGCTWPSRSSNLLKERVMMLARKAPGRIRRIAGAGLIAMAALAAGLASWAAQAPKPPTAEIEAVGVTPAPQEAPVFIPNRTAESVLAPKVMDEEFLDATPEAMNIIGALRVTVGAMIGPDLPRVRSIPERQIVEARLFVRLPGGDVLGPHRILSSLPRDITTEEFAEDPRFSGGMVANVEADGSLQLGFGLSIEGQPLHLRSLRMKSGETAVVELAGGYIANVTATLRPMNEQELRRAKQRAERRAVPIPAAAAPDDQVPTAPYGAAQPPTTPPSTGRAPISQLMPPRSDEEYGLFSTRLGQASQPAGAFRVLLQQHTPVMASLESDYPGQRTIPEGHIIEASVSVRLPRGETIGPYRMYSSIADGWKSSEMANGDEGFDADGDEHFIGAMLGSVGPDETITMKFALVIEGQPIRVVGATAKSGQTLEIDIAGGYRLTIKPLLRPFTELEKRRDHRSKQSQASEPARPQPAKINPDWPGPSFPQQPTPAAVDLSALANDRIVCSAWRTKFSNDPKVDVDRIGGSPITIAFDAAGKVSVAPTVASAGFAADAFPLGLATQEMRLIQQRADRFRYIGRSPLLADQLMLNEIDTTAPSLTWERIRREGGITYRTHFFLRCTH